MRRLQRQAFTLLLVTRRQPRQQVRADRQRQSLDPAHPSSSAESKADCSIHIMIPEGKDLFDGWRGFGWTRA
jgi:hypothetical protein